MGASLSSTLARSTRSAPWRCKRRGSHSCSRSPPPTAASCGLTVPLKIMCSRKCVVPASVLTPTVAVRVAREDSVATRRPMGRVVIRVAAGGGRGEWACGPRWRGVGRQAYWRNRELGSSRSFILDRTASVEADRANKGMRGAGSVTGRQTRRSFCSPSRSGRAEERPNLQFVGRLHPKLRPL